MTQPSRFTRTGVDATGLSAPDISGASFSQQGVVDTSGLTRGQAASTLVSGVTNLVADVGQVGLDAHEGFAKARLEAEQETNIDAFLKSRDPAHQATQRGLFQEAAVDLSNLQTRQDALIQGEGIFPAMEQTSPEYAAIINRLKAAQDQGVMTKAELEMRVLKTTREAINKNPGLARELTQHAEQVLELSGARQTQEFEDNIAKLEAKRYEQARTSIIQQAVKRNIPFDQLNPDVAELERTVREQVINENALQQAEDFAKLDAEEKAAQKEVALKMAPKAIQGGFQDFHAKALELFGPDMSPSEIQTALSALRNLGEVQKGVVSSLLSGAEFSSSEKKPFQETANSQVNVFVKSVEDNITSKDIVGFMKNQLSMITMMQETALREEFDVSRINLMNQSMQGLGAQIFANLSPAIQEKQAANFMNIMSGDLSGNKFKKMSESKDINPNKPDVISALGGILRGTVERDSDSEDLKSRKDPKAFETAIGVFTEQLITNPRGMSSETRFELLSSLVNEMQGRDVNEYLNNATAETKRNLGDMYDQYRIVLTNQRDKAIVKAESQGARVDFRISPDGNMSFNVSHEDNAKALKIARELNGGVGKRSNELVGAFGTLYGLDRVKTVELLKGNFDPRAVDDNLRDDDPTVSFIKGKEGFSEDAYLDEAGVPTIGYGFTKIDGKPVQLGDVITKEESDKIVKTQIQEHSTFLGKIEKTLSPSQKRALSSFEYNFGGNIWNKTGKPIIAAINEGDLEKAAEIMRRHNKAEDPITKKLVVLRGLTIRREEEAQMLLAGN